MSAGRGFPTEAAAAPARGGLLRLLPLAVLAAGLGLFFAFGLHRYVSFATLAGHRAALGLWVEAHPLLAPAAYIAVYIAAVAFSLPGGALLTALGGFLFGTVCGTGYALVGATAGATALFVAARTALGAGLRARTGAVLERMQAGFRRDAFNYLLVLRLVPVFPFFLVNLAPAFVDVSLRVYVAATALGIIPATFVFASVGNGLGAVFDNGQEPDFGLIFTAPVLLPIAGLAVLALIPVVYRHVKGRAR